MEDDAVAEIRQEVERGDFFSRQDTRRRSASMESMLQGGYSPVGIAANRRMRSCSRCGKQGHNRVTCGRAAARFRLPTRLCTKCGQRGHYEILCLNPATSIVMVDQVNHTEDDGAVVGADTPVKPCKWHEMKKGLEKSVP